MSKNTETAIAPVKAASNLPANIFGKLKFSQKTLPPLLKPVEVPVGSTIYGYIHDVVPSPVREIKGCVLWLILIDGSERTFPCGGVLRNALLEAEPERMKDDTDETFGARLVASLKHRIGHVLSAHRTPDGVSKRYSKAMRMFNVGLSDEKMTRDEWLGMVEKSR